MTDRRLSLVAYLLLICIVFADGVFAQVGVAAGDAPAGQAIEKIPLTAGRSTVM